MTIFAQCINVLNYKLEWMYCQNFGAIKSVEKGWISEAGR